jgi:hypothetical protein
VGIRKATAKNGRTARKSVQENTMPTKTPVDVVQARKNVADLVRDSGAEIAMGMIEGAKAGQLASAHGAADRTCDFQEHSSGSSADQRR